MPRIPNWKDLHLFRPSAEWALCATAEISVRQFSMTFLDRIGSTIADSPCSPLFQHQASHHRIEIDRMFAAASRV